MTRPFEGVRIVDFTQVLAGPFCTYQLGLLGADIVKIERPGGEELRFSPVFPEWAKKSLSPTWMSVNSNKRSLTLDLKKPAAVAIVPQIRIPRHNLRKSIAEPFQSWPRNAASAGMKG